MQNKNGTEEFEGIGYKNRVSAWILLIGSIVSLILVIFISTSKPKNYVLFIVMFSLLAVISLISFIIEKTRPTIVVFLSNNGVKIRKCFTWEIIPFDNIDQVDYKLNLVRNYEVMLCGTGSLIIQSKTRKFVVRDVDSVTDCYEKITESLKEYRGNKENQS